jgi:hypothetical protein
VLIARVYNEQQKVRADSIEHAFESKQGWFSNQTAVVILILLFVVFLFLVLSRRRKARERLRKETSRQERDAKKQN